MKRLFSLIKKVFKFVKTIFNNNPVDAVNKITDNAATIASVAIGAYASFNIIKSRFEKAASSRKKNSDSGLAPIDYIHESRKNRSTLNSVRRGNKVTDEDLVVLKEIAKERNNVFKTASPKMQKRILLIEGFDFEKYKKEFYYEKAHPFAKFKKSLSKFGKITNDKPFREEVDYGSMNFIMRPLDKFVHWIKADPTPMKREQIHIINREMLTNSFEGDIKEWNNVMNMVPFDRIFNDYEIPVSFSTRADAERAEIYAKTAFRNKTYSGYVKDNIKQIMKGRSTMPTALEFLDDFTPSKKKKKKKKSSDQKSWKKYKSGSKQSKKEMEADEALAKKKAKETYNYFYEKALKGEYDYDGYWK